MVEVPKYIYSIRDKKTGKLINRKSGSGNAFFVREGLARNKLYGNDEEVVRFKLIEE